VHPGYAATRVRRAALRRGLDGTLLAASARLAGQAARGFVVELLVWASWMEQRQAAAEQRTALMQCFTTRGGDVTTHDGRWTGGY
jgi:hypothetical protein